MAYNHNSQSGFALLVSLIVVAAILSVGLVILELSIKQVRLAATTKDSEIAFHAANAGMECARYWRREENTRLLEGRTTAAIDCFGESVGSVDANVPLSPNLSTESDGDAYFYTYEVSWAGDRCSVISMVVAVAEQSGSGVVVSDIATLIPGYPPGDTFTCPAGGQCTAVAVQGYNRQCGAKNNYGTIEREILLRF